MHPIDANGTSLPLQLPPFPRIVVLCPCIAVVVSEFILLPLLVSLLLFNSPFKTLAVIFSQSSEIPWVCLTPFNDFHIYRMTFTFLSPRKHFLILAQAAFLWLILSAVVPCQSHMQWLTILPTFHISVPSLKQFPQPGPFFTFHHLTESNSFLVKHANLEHYSYLKKRFR